MTLLGAVRNWTMMEWSSANGFRRISKSVGFMMKTWPKRDSERAGRSQREEHTQHITSEARLQNEECFLEIHTSMERAENFHCLPSYSCGNVVERGKQNFATLDIGWTNEWHRYWNKNTDANIGEVDEITKTNDERSDLPTVINWYPLMWHLHNKK